MPPADPPTETTLPAKTTLNAANLEALGPSRLATLVLELAEGDAAAKRRLRLELAGRHQPEEVARAVRKRLATVARARGSLDVERQRALARDLDAHRRALVDHLAPHRPREALDLMLRLVELKPGILERCAWLDDATAALFEATVTDLPALVDAAGPPFEELGERLARAVPDDGWLGAGAVLESVVPRLDAAGRARLRARLEAARAGEPAATRREFDAVPRVVGALARLADLEGDVDAYTALFDAEQRRNPTIAARIARRLLAAGRAEQAAAALAEAPLRGGRRREREEVEADVMEALGDVAGAQARRWAGFAETLDADHLRAYLRRLADFDDVEAEKRAFRHVHAFPQVHAALAFLLAWPAPREAATLVLARAEELDGDRWELLSPAAETLEERYPLAGMLLRRALIEATLTRKRTTRYGHAARHWRACAELADRIDDVDRFETHDAFRRRIEATHGRKSGFWSRVAER